MDATAIRRSTVLFDTKGLVYTSRPGIEDDKASVGLHDDDLAALGLAPDASPVDAVRALRPGTLIGTTQTPGAFTEELLRTLAAGCPSPLVFPLSNPTSKTEATPEQVADWTDGRAMCATGSPFPPVVRGDRTCVVGPGEQLVHLPRRRPRRDRGRCPGRARRRLPRRRPDAGRDGRPGSARLRGALPAGLRAAGRVARDRDRRGARDRHGPRGAAPRGRATGLALATAAVDAAIWWPDYPAYEPA